METKNIDKECTVKQSNNLAISKYTLTTLEQRILFAICSQMPRNTDDFVSVRMSVSELADFCGISSKNRYTAIRQISDKLMRRIVTIPTSDGGEYTSHWLQSRRYYPKDSSIEFKLDSDLKREFLKLRKAYLDIPAIMLMSFKRSYSSRIYLILRRMLESSGAKSCSFDYRLSFFREKFELGKTYDKLSNLQNGVLEPALAEINAKSDISVQHEYTKSGRTYTKIKFTVSLKAKQALPVSDTSQNVPEAPQSSSEPAATSPLPPAPEAVSTQEQELEKLGQTKLFAMPSSQPPATSAPHHEQDQDDEKKKRQLFWDNEILFSKLSRYFLNEQIEELIIKYGAERVSSNYDYAERNKSGKRNMAGWIVSCMDCDHAAAERAIYVLNKQQAEREREELMARLEPMPKIELDPNDKRTVRERFADLKNDLKKRKG